MIAAVESDVSDNTDTLAVHRTKLDANEQRADTARNTVISNIETDVSSRALKSDTVNQVRTTHPNIPGLAADSLGRVLKVDAAGNLFNGYLPAAGGTSPWTTKPDFSIYPLDIGDSTTFKVKYDGEMLAKRIGINAANADIEGIKWNGGSFIDEPSSNMRISSAGGLEIKSGISNDITLVTYTTEILRADYATLSVGIGTATPESKLHVAGTFRASDTIRSGDYTTYSYFIPGGTLQTSSDSTIKRDISIINAPQNMFSRFLSVKPRKYRWRPEAFRGVTFESTPDTLTTSERWALVAEDSIKAERMAERWQIGFLAQEFNYQIFGRANSKELDFSEVTATLWVTLQETIKEANNLRGRISVLESQVAAGAAKLQELEARIEALE